MVTMKVSFDIEKIDGIEYIKLNDFLLNNFGEKNENNNST
jgi:hypothetical protein